MPEILALMIPITALLIPISVIWTKHRQRMEELRLGGRGVAAGLVEEVRKLQEQVTELRDTTTRYDLSFDAALQRIEGRVTAVEQRMNAIEGDRRIENRR